MVVFLSGVGWPLTCISGFPQARGCRCLPLVRTPLQSPDWPTPNTHKVHIPLPSLPYLRGFTCTSLVIQVGVSQLHKRWAHWIQRPMQVRHHLGREQPDPRRSRAWARRGIHHPVAKPHWRRDRTYSPKHRQSAPKALPPLCLSKDLKWE